MLVRVVHIVVCVIYIYCVVLVCAVVQVVVGDAPVNCFLVV